jgi:hypothetical protein
VSDSERVLIVRDALAPNHFYVVVALALFGFASIWPYYPAIGAGFAFIGLLVALDDVIEYMAGFPTPLDQVWKGDIFSAIKIIE